MHEKVYASYVLLSNPVQRPWICFKCGTQGRDSGYIPEAGMSYDDLVQHFKEKGGVQCEIAIERVNPENSTSGVTDCLGNQ